MKKLALIVACLASIIICSCKKDPGEGGFATIKGKLFIKDYNSYFTIVNDSFYVQGENVYITYGSDVNVADSRKTSINGEFQFDYLRKGKYTIFAVSKDSTSLSSSKTVAIKKEVEITEKKQVIDIGDLIILK